MNPLFAFATGNISTPVINVIRKRVILMIDENNSNLKKLSQTLFKVLLKKDEAKYPTGSAQTISHRQGQLNDDIDRIEQLELCVSAARKTEGYDQYD